MSVFGIDYESVSGNPAKQTFEVNNAVHMHFDTLDSEDVNLGFQPSLLIVSYETYGSQRANCWSAYDSGYFTRRVGTSAVDRLSVGQNATGSIKQITASGFKLMYYSDLQNIDVYAIK